MKKRILAFGDSNTWGWDPANQPGAAPKRFPDEVRWTGVLQARLGEGYTVINEGLNGRTTVWEDPIEEFRCGKDQIIPVMDTQAPLDLAIIMVGTNDLKNRFGVPPSDIAAGAKVLVTRALARRDAFWNQQPKVLLVCPPPLGAVSKTWMGSSFGGSEEKSKELDAHYKAVAAQCGVGYLYAGQFIETGDIDGLHLERGAHQKLGDAIAKKVLEMLG